MLYLPIALRGSDKHQAGLEWITNTFSPFQLSDITMWTDLSRHQAGDLDIFDGIYIGGGNTYYLLSQLISSGFDHILKNYVLQGGILYGGSAGAVVLGRDIQTVRHLDSNDVGLAKLGGLDLAEGYSVWVHYQSEDDHSIFDYITEIKVPVLAISEHSGIVIDQTGMQSVGFETAYCFDETGKHPV